MDATVKAKGRSCWTWEQNKAFELALATYKDNCIDRWQKVAASVPGKTVEEIKHQYKLLVEDINNIESDLVPLPNYKGLTDHFADNDTNIEDELHVIPCKKGKGPKEDQERGRDKHGVLMSTGGCTLITFILGIIFILQLILALLQNG